jgi:hypothetical protein
MRAVAHRKVDGIEPRAHGHDAQSRPLRRRWSAAYLRGYNSRRREEQHKLAHVKKCI